MSDKLVAGIDPSVAIEETPLPESGITFVTDQMIGAEQLSQGELEVNSIPSDYANITDFVAGGPEGDTIDSENNSTDVQFESEQPFIQEPSSLEVSPFIPGFGLTSHQALFDEQITSLPPEETIVEDQPITTSQRTSTLDECSVNPELCYEPTQHQSVDICQEQPDLPQCIEEDTDIEYSDLSDENTAPSYFEEDIGGYQHEEQDFSEENSGEEDDYEEVGGYNAAEEDYSEEENTGDEETMMKPRRRSG